MNIRKGIVFHTFGRLIHLTSLNMPFIDVANQQGKTISKTQKEL